jgi:hypothetical protein
LLAAVVAIFDVHGDAKECNELEANSPVTELAVPLEVDPLPPPPPLIAAAAAATLPLQWAYVDTAAAAAAAGSQQPFRNSEIQRERKLLQYEWDCWRFELLLCNGTAISSLFGIS